MIKFVWFVGLFPLNQLQHLYKYQLFNADRKIIWVILFEALSCEISGKIFPREIWASRHLNSPIYFRVSSGKLHKSKSSNSRKTNSLSVPCAMCIESWISTTNSIVKVKHKKYNKYFCMSKTEKQKKMRVRFRFALLFILLFPVRVPFNHYLILRLPWSEKQVILYIYIY